jgi:hypothetical protein
MFPFNISLLVISSLSLLGLRFLSLYVQRFKSVLLEIVMDLWLLLQVLLLICQSLGVFYDNGPTTLEKYIVPVCNNL